MSNYALCLCGHGTSHHRNGSGVCDDFCAAGARPGSCGGGHSCRCQAFSLWDQRSARDEFAKAALTGLLAGLSETNAIPHPGVIAARAFEYADAMLAESHEKAK